MASSRKSLFMEGTKKPLNSPKAARPHAVQVASPAKSNKASVGKKFKPKVKSDKEKVVVITEESCKQQDVGVVSTEKSEFVGDDQMEIDKTPTEELDVSTDRVSPKDVNLEIKEPEKTLESHVGRGRSDSDERFRPIFRLGSHTEGEEEAGSDTNENVSEMDQGNMALPQFKKGSTSTPIRLNISLAASANDTSHTRLHKKHSVTDEVEDMSLSSSGFSPCSTSASFKSFDGRNRIDDFSDDSDCPKLRESIDLSDDAEVASLTKPLNQQLRVLTSLSPGTQSSSPDCRSSSPVSAEAKTGGELIRRLSDHLMFVDYLRRRDLSSCVSHFPSDMTITNFRNLTDEELKEKYSIESGTLRAKLMRAIVHATREELDTDESDGGHPPSPIPTSPIIRRCHDELPLGIPSTFRRLQRTLSEDSRQRRRESLPSTPISLPTNLANFSGSGLHHSGLASTSTGQGVGQTVSALVEPNLLRMKNSILGQSAPSLTAGMQPYEEDATRREHVPGTAYPLSVTPTLSCDGEEGTVARQIKKIENTPGRIPNASKRRRERIQEAKRTHPRTIENVSKNR
ncbi:hypothetical protein FSP39_024465 [Pinctada imbricata]|uniref:Uncharacterized protein n=1 Tax=Pinctada imbricata TaxID=66713 RepID=A0AA88Y1B5_PINIB|nr:hypothetical protein FSP39_024465 [Pinctada imbricata]